LVCSQKYLMRHVVMFLLVPHANCLNNTAPLLVSPVPRPPSPVPRSRTWFPGCRSGQVRSGQVRSGQVRSAQPSPAQPVALL
jgi:hypothetical protein